MSLKQMFADFAATAPQAETVPCPCPEVPAMDGKIFARAIDGNVYADYAKSIPRNSRDAYWIVRPMLWALCDEKGARIFENDAMDMARLMKLPVKVLLRWKAIIDRLNYDTQEDEEEKKSEPAENSTTS